MNLYLDTHPDDMEAIEYYAQIKDKYCDYMTKYADYYGPLDKLHISNDNYWMWVATQCLGKWRTADMWNYEKDLSIL